MKERTALLLIGAAGFLAVMLFIVVISSRVGKSYQTGLSTIQTTIQEPPATREKRNVKRITVVKDDGSCLEMTPDGVVKNLASCNGDVTDVNRLSDPKHLLDLFQFASQVDITKYRSKPTSGTFTTLVIETDSGTTVIYVPNGGGNGGGSGGGGGGGGGGGVGDIIDLIIGDLPQPTPTPDPNQPTPTPTIPGSIPLPTETPTPTMLPGSTPTDEPMPTDPVDNPFTCGFVNTPKGKRPFNISNYVCSTQPSPPPAH